MLRSESQYFPTCSWDSFHFSKLKYIHNRFLAVCTVCAAETPDENITATCTGAGVLCDNSTCTPRCQDRPCGELVTRSNVPTHVPCVHSRLPTHVGKTSRCTHSQLGGGGLSRHTGTDDAHGDVSAVPHSVGCKGHFLTQVCEGKNKGCA